MNLTYEQIEEHKKPQQTHKTQLYYMDDLKATSRMKIIGALTTEDTNHIESSTCNLELWPDRKSVV